MNRDMNHRTHKTNHNHKIRHKTNHEINREIDHRDRGYIIKISETNKILQKYRNLPLTYELIRKIVYEMDESIQVKMKDMITTNDVIRM